MHQVFTALWEKRSNLHLDTPIRSYLYTSVQNRCLNYIRDRKKFVDNELPETTEMLAQLVEDKKFIENEELKNKIHQSIKELPEACRNIFLLSKFENKKYREIAEELNISIKTVETQMSKALRHMRESLSQYVSVLLIILTIINSLK